MTCQATLKSIEIGDDDLTVKPAIEHRVFGGLWMVLPESQVPPHYTHERRVNSYGHLTETACTLNGPGLFVYRSISDLEIGRDAREIEFDLT